jgi:hypothetical protein
MITTELAERLCKRAMIVRVDDLVGKGQVAAILET